MTRDTYATPPGSVRAARFGVRGVLPNALPRMESIRLGRRLVAALAAAVQAGAGVVIHHQQSADGELAWQLEDLGQAGGHDGSAALSAALTAAGHPFQFEWQSTPPTAGEATFRATLAPIAHALCVSGGLGFQAGDIETTAAQVYLPENLPLRPGAFDSLGEIVRAANAPCAVAVTLSRILLTPSELGFLRHVTAAGTAHADWIETWRRVGDGWRLGCEVRANETLPVSFLHLVGTEVFGSPVQIDPAEKEQSPDGRLCLDLNTARPSGVTLPALFPAGALLSSPRRRRLYNRTLPTLPSTGAVLGEVDCQGRTAPLRLSAMARDRHCYVLGATGTGKSTLLRHLLVQDIAAGEGVALIDPHGDLYAEVLATIPPERQADVVLFEPGGPSRAPGLNFLEIADGPGRSIQRNFVVNEMLGIFDQLWDMRQCGGPMFQLYFHNALLLLMASDVPGVTLTELPLIFEDHAFRNRLKAGCHDPLVSSFWTHQAERASGDASLQNMAPYITSKLNPFVNSAVLRPILGQSRSTLGFRRLLGGRKIFLADLSKARLGANEARLLGMMLLGKLFAAAMENGAGTPAARRVPFHVYVDETQNFLTDTLATMLAEARKFGLRLTLANQNLAQLHGQGRGQLLETILGNVGSFVFFRLGPADAEKLALYTRPQFDAADLERLPNFCCAGRLLADDGPIEPLVFRTLPPSPVRADAAARAAMRWRQRRYTRPLADIEAEILRRRNPALLELERLLAR